MPFPLALRRAPLALFAGAAVAVTTSRPVWLDAPTPSKRLSIYPTPTPEIVLEETHTDLQRQIGVVRQHGTHLYSESRKTVQGTVDKWIGVEEAVERKVKEIIPKDEDLTPGILFVGVAALAGSVVARNRAFPIRFLLPPTILLLAFPQFLPKTSHNIRGYLAQLEDTHAPSFAAQHDATKAQIAQSTADARRLYSESVEKGRNSIQHGVGLIEEWSGLKLGVKKNLEGDVVKVEVGKRN